MPSLSWIGKDKVINHHFDVPFRFLEHVYGFDNGHESSASLNNGNKIIHGDNLEALKSLLPEYEGKIKCIYIDPPYNTGNEHWVYNDNVSDPKLKKWLGRVVGKEAEDLTRHDKWLCMMYPRLVLLHKLLADDGAIFVSIDDHEQANLKLVMDEIFGSANFANNVIWQKKFSPQNDAKYFSDNHDFIICYAKNKPNWKRNLLRRTEAQNERYKNPDNDPRGLWTSGDVSVKTYSAATDYPITTPSGRKVNPPGGYSWRFSEEKFLELVRDGRIWFGARGNNVPRLKRFLLDVQQGTVPLTVWPYHEVGHNQSAKQELKKIFFDSPVPFDTPKPPTLLNRIIELTCGKDDLVLDSFAGSATTAHAVLSLNRQDGGSRKFILIEMEDYAATITAERVKRVIRGYADKPGTGGGFDYYELGATLFNEENEISISVSKSDLRQYVYYAEVRKNLLLHDHGDNSYFLDMCNNTAYYLYYEPGRLTTLNYEFLSTIRTRAAQYIIYADNCLLSREFMHRHKIVFKKTQVDLAKI